MISMNYEGYEKYMESGSIENRYKYETESDASKKISKALKEMRDEQKIIESEYNSTTETVSSVILICGIIVAILGILISAGSAGFGGFMFGLFILTNIIIWPTLGIQKLYERKRNKNLKLKLQNIEAEERGKEVRLSNEAREKYNSKIERYHSNVEQTVQRLMANQANINPMVDYSVEMFKRMILHADSNSSKKFIECNFTYVVTTTEIKYLYDSEYTNSKDDFNFEMQRYRNLALEYECEGLALALANVLSDRMKALYPPNTVSITTSNVDAKVTMKFKAPNENFVVARDIL